MARPLDDHRHADAALVEVALVAAPGAVGVEEIRVGAAFEVRAVVAGKDDKGVLSQTFLVEIRQQPSYGAVHVGDERGIALGVHRPVLLSVIPRRLVDDIWFVRSVIGQIEEEGLLLVASNESDGVVCGDVGVVTYMGIMGVLLDGGQ